MNSIGTVLAAAFAGLAVAISAAAYRHSRRLNHVQLDVEPFRYWHSDDKEKKPEDAGLAIRVENNGAIEAFVTGLVAEVSGGAPFETGYIRGNFEQQESKRWFPLTLYPGRHFDFFFAEYKQNPSTGSGYFSYTDQKMDPRWTDVSNVRVDASNTGFYVKGTKNRRTLHLMLREFQRARLTVEKALKPL